MSDGQLGDAERLEKIRAILAEPVPRWFQNAHRRANSYAEQLRRIAAVAGGGDNPPSQADETAHM